MYHRATYNKSSSYIYIYIKLCRTPLNCTCKLFVAGAYAQSAFDYVRPASIIHGHCLVPHKHILINEDADQSRHETCSTQYHTHYLQCDLLQEGDIQSITILTDIMWKSLQAGMAIIPQLTHNRLCKTSKTKSSSSSFSPSSSRILLTLLHSPHPPPSFH